MACGATMLSWGWSLVCSNLCFVVCSWWSSWGLWDGSKLCLDQTSFLVSSAVFEERGDWVVRGIYPGECLCIIRGGVEHEGSAGIRIVSIRCVSVACYSRGEVMTNNCIGSLEVVFRVHLFVLNYV